MILGWFKRNRRQRVRMQSFPEEWREMLSRNAVFYGDLNADEQAKLRGDIQVFIAEKNWEGCGGQEMNDEIKVTIAAQVCRLVLGFEGEFFDSVMSILVYPTPYVAKSQTVVSGNVAIEGREHRDGEAWHRGPVILCWPEVLAGSKGMRPGNLVLHEFAHQLDMQNGRYADGVPPLESREQFRRWQEVMEAEYERLTEDCRERRPVLLDCYGVKNRAEFFAVATECFFERPHDLMHWGEELYEVLRDYYRQDPAKL